MNGKQLKNSILQLAIQGKLVPQNPADEPASALLQRIRAEKEQLVKEGKLKKKDLVTTPISDEEKPFEIPESWKVCRVKDILLKITDGTHHSPINTETGDYKYITAKNIKESGVSLANISYVSKEVHDEIFARCNPSFGDILYIKDGATTGVCCINQLNEDFSMLSSVALLKPPSNLYTPFLLYCLRSPICYDSVRDSMKGTGITRITLTKIEQWIIPLPPLAEQHRIVEKIEELMPLVEEYDKAQTKLDDLNRKLPEALKKSILQEAIMGKLVPQDPNDEPASVLLQRIRAEKEQLVKDGKLKKKDLVTTPITDEEKPFVIPESWEWCRLGEIVVLLSGQDLTPNRYFDSEKGIPYITGASHFVNGSLKVSRWTDSPTSVSHLGDLLITCKGTVGTMAYNTIGDIHIARQIMAITPILAFLPYIQHYLGYIVPELEKQAHSIIPGISREVLLSSIIPLPPLSEQHRIVAKIEELLGVLG